MDLKLEDALLYLAGPEKKDFYARVAMCLPRRESTEVDYLGVTVTDGEYEFLYNPEGIAKLTVPELTHLLHHNIVHVENNHLGRSLMTRGELTSAGLTEEQIHKVTQQAADLAANSQIRKYTHDGSLAHAMESETLESPLLPEDIGLNATVANTYEHYQTHVRRMIVQEEEAEEGDDGKGDSRSNDHSGWGKSNTRDKNGDIDPNGSTDVGDMSGEGIQALGQALQTNADEIIETAAILHEAGRGTLPAHIAERVAQMHMQVTVPWDAILKNVLRSKLCEQRIRTTQRPRRRMPTKEFMLPGKKHDRTFTIVYIIDTSGSVSAVEAAKGFKACTSLFDQEGDGLEMWCILADTQVNKTWQVYKGDELGTLHGRGGTDFNAALLAAVEKNPDMIAYYTDGCAPAPETASIPTCPLVWIISESSWTRSDHLPGTVVNMESM